MYTLNVSAHLENLDDALVGRFIKTRLAKAAGWEHAPPLLSKEDEAALVKAGVIEDPGALLSYEDSERATLQDIVAEWNLLGHPFHRVLKITPSRRRHIAARLKEWPKLSDWKHAIGRIKASPWHRGENERGWIATFKWLVVCPDTMMRIMEGATCRAADSDDNMPSASRM